MKKQILCTLTLTLPLFCAASSPEELGHQLIEAVRKNDYNLVLKLLESGANVNQRDNYRNTTLHLAAERDRTDIAELLLSHGADVHAKNIHGSTPLHWTAPYGDTKIVGLLLAHGAKINEKNKKGETLLHWVASSRNTEMIRFLLNPHS